MILYTMGFTGKSAETFFSLLQMNGVARLVDIRLNNTSQLAAFTKKNDLRYFLQVICSIAYDHEVQLAPTAEILQAYKKKEIDWGTYEVQFTELLVTRQVENLDQSRFDNACLLCSEPKPVKCHRRLVAEYLQAHWENVEIFHL
jgi:uncharacterized protein (DUF488 family)